jgi:hypothetical protein
MYHQKLDPSISRIYEISFEPYNFVTKQVPPELALEDGNSSVFGKAVFYKVCETTDKSRKAVIRI